MKIEIYEAVQRKAQNPYRAAERIGIGAVCKACSHNDAEDPDHKKRRDDTHLGGGMQIVVVRVDGAHVQARRPELAGG